MVRRVVQTKNINRWSGPIDIYIGGLSTNKIIILIQGLGGCERVGEDS